MCGFNHRQQYNCALTRTKNAPNLIQTVHYDDLNLMISSVSISAGQINSGVFLNTQALKIDPCFKKTP